MSLSLLAPWGLAALAALLLPLLVHLARREEQLVGLGDDTKRRDPPAGLAHEPCLRVRGGLLRSKDGHPCEHRECADRGRGCLLAEPARRDRERKAERDRGKAYHATRPGDGRREQQPTRHDGRESEQASEDDSHAAQNSA